MFPNQMSSVSSMTGMKLGRKKTHRGKRGGRGKSKNQHHEQAKSHMADAMKAGTPQDAHGHLFKALSALNKARAGAKPSSGVASPEMPPAASAAPPDKTSDLVSALSAYASRPH